MSNVVRTIPNLINGISQQAPTLRLDTQAEQQLNAFSSVDGGLRKRPPSDYLREVPGDIESFFHITDRPDSLYLTSVKSNGATNEIAVRTMDNGTATPTVSAPNGLGYLECSNPSRDIRAVTIADTTILLNKTKVVALSATTTPVQPNEAMISIDGVTADISYKVYIDGVMRADFTTTQTPSSYSANNIAEQLYDDLVAAALPDFTFTRVDSNIHVVKSSGTFDLSVDDTRAGTLISSIQGSVGKFTDLPEKATDGYLARVTSEDGVESTDYWVKFVADDSSLSISTGTWEEAPAPEEKFQFDASTMPHTLAPDPSNPGDFIFQAIDWNERTAGGGEALPAPSMIGKTLSEVFYHEARLGFLSDINVVMSASGDLFNFWRTTATDLLDDDPIDVQVASDSGSKLENAIAFDERLIVFSKREQFILQGSPTLTPVSVSSQLVTRFNSATRTRPVHIGRNLYFPYTRGEFSGVREYFVAPDLDSFDAADVTAHVPRYIPGEVRRITATTNEDIVALVPTGETNAVYIYKFFWNGNQKIQSSWSKIDFGGNVFHAEFIDSDLYLVLGKFNEGEDADTSSLVRLKFSTEENPTAYLDRRVDESQVSASYDAGLDITTLTLPYGPCPSTAKVVVRKDSPDLVEGRVLSINSIDVGLKQIVLDGDLTGELFYVGQNYLMSYRFSTAYIKREGRSGGQTIESGGRVQVRRWRLVYEDSGFFKVLVTIEGRDPRVYTWSGKTLGSINAIIDQPSIDSGEYSVPVAGRNTASSVEIVNDSHLPSNFTSASWEADFIQRGRI